MTQVILDECLNPALRAKIKKLAELNLDSDSIWDLLDPNLKSYDDAMYTEVEKYVKYVLWLRETNRPLDNAYEKYKSYTQTIDRDFKRKLAHRLELEQKRRDQERIDELSALMKYSRQKKSVIQQKETSTMAPIMPKAVREEVAPNEVKKTQVTEEYNEHVVEIEDTESDLDFVEPTIAKTEMTTTLEPNDLLFETMTQAMPETTMIVKLEPSSTLDEVEEEKTLTLQSSEATGKTDEALAFYQQLEAKYQPVEENPPLATYEVGAKVNYQNEDYIVVKVETIKDFFDHPEIVITLKSIDNKTLIQVNRQQIERQK